MADGVLVWALKGNQGWREASGRAHVVDGVELLRHWRWEEWDAEGLVVVKLDGCSGLRRCRWRRKRWTLARVEEFTLEKAWGGCGCGGAGSFRRGALLVEGSCLSAW